MEIPHRLAGRDWAIEHRYGVFASRMTGGDVDHTNLISVVDPRGMMRVQYLGIRSILTSCAVTS